MILLVESISGARKKHLSKEVIRRGQKTQQSIRMMMMIILYVLCQLIRFMSNDRKKNEGKKRI